MSVTALLVLAAEEAEHSPTAFYVGGSLFAVWAIALALVGLSRPDFPTSTGAARGLYGVSALLMVVAAYTAITSG